VSRGFHSEDELREMEEHPGEMSRHIGRTKPYDCSYPVMVKRPRIVVSEPLPEPYQESEVANGEV
jgi:hypothetical protein